MIPPGVMWKKANNY